MSYIYKITNIINNKIYIGQTSQDINTRFRQHINCAKRNDDGYLYRAMRKHGFDNFIVEEIEHVEDLEKLNEREIFWINFYNSTDRNIGYNISSGGSGRRKITQNDIEKILQLWNDGFGPFEIANKIGVHRNTIKKYLNNNGITYEDIQKRKAERSSYFQRLKSKQVIQYDLDNKYIQTFDSIYDAADKMNINYRTLYVICKKSNSGYYSGYLWKFKDNDDPFKKSPRSKKVLKIDIETKEVLEIYETISEAARAVGGHESAIGRVCNRKNNKKTSKGFIWRFENDNEFLNEKIDNERSTV